jgi:hypothetical protein
MYHKPLDRPKGAGPAAALRNGRLAIPRDTGRSGHLETMIVLCTMVVLAVALGLAMGVPVAMMLHDICISIRC